MDESSILDRHGLVRRIKRKRFKAEGTVLHSAQNSNDLWCADYKGEFMLGDKRYCYPLTVTDFSSRYLLACEALESNKELYAFNIFERVFKEYGLPKTIRTDNGIPFAAPHALFGLSKLSVWWLRQGLPEVAYPFHDKTITVSYCGRICMGRKKINLGRSFAGQNVGIKEVEDGIWLVSFMNYDLAHMSAVRHRLHQIPET